MKGKKKIRKERRINPKKKKKKGKTEKWNERRACHPKDKMMLSLAHAEANL